MRIKAFIFWTVSTLLAFVASHAADSSTDVIAVTPAGNPEPLGAMAITGSFRSALLMAGFLAVAYTYRRAWLNFRGVKAS